MSLFATNGGYTFIYEEMLSRTGPPTSMVTVMVPGMTSLADTIFALKCFSYHDADAWGSVDLMCTWLIEYCMLLLLIVVKCRSPRYQLLRWSKWRRVPSVFSGDQETASAIVVELAD